MTPISSVDEHEARINSHPQFVTEIDGTNIHFLHIRSAEHDAFPIVTQGWLGTEFEFGRVSPPLTSPDREMS
ncbi:epoxide hydrolase N-terminal domain-containing protein [Nocardia beijingensis]|uniref:epoxide hydrolase N-terminal domain-containing protein n=1 Tax=Nocardia beijingensis TaxID=95162 RepID=UPI0018954B2D|nr:epoxide hydrolase N-terminal domain-containing protein [Nocardia beijingensis]MBF6465218.1 epoxide hydrolase N-terminal domain-containing protein [Nocardia beijingensis]